MIALYDIKNIHIEVTNVCNKECSCCTRFCGHHKKPFFMDMATVEKALQSMDGFAHSIGIMGGEPTLHPQFIEICDLMQRYIPIERRAFFTNGAQWTQYKNVIEATFLPQNIVYNDHTHVEGHHQPLLVASADIVQDRQLWRELVDNCWIQCRWSASITPKGCFFCEVAAALDMLFNGPGGYPIEPDWWKKAPGDFQDQIERYCVNCSAAVPMPPVDANAGMDPVSPRIADMLEVVESPRYRRGKTRLFVGGLTSEQISSCRIDWKPWSHRPFRQCGPNRYLNEHGNIVDHKVFHAG